jgi:hypothetical protein
MESRKRPHEGDTPVSVKKRALASTLDSPVTAVSPNDAADEPQHDEELEVSCLGPYSAFYGTTSCMRASIRNP